jgi:hypothetical protein
MTVIYINDRQKDSIFIVILFVLFGSPIIFILISIPPLGDFVWHDIRTGVKVCKGYGIAHPGLIGLIYDIGQGRCCYYDRYPSGSSGAQWLCVNDAVLNESLRLR